MNLNLEAFREIISTALYLKIVGVRVLVLIHVHVFFEGHLNLEVF